MSKNSTLSVYIPPTLSVSDMQVSNPSDGDTVVIDHGVYGIYIDPTLTLTTLTIEMPSRPIDGQELYIVFGGSIGSIIAGSVVVTLTIIPSSTGIGQSLIPTTGANYTSASAATRIRAKYRQDTLQWYI